MCSHDGQILSKEFQDSVHNAALRVWDPNSDALVRSYPCSILAARRIDSLSVYPSSAIVSHRGFDAFNILLSF